MTMTEIQLKTDRFAAKMNSQELCKAQEIIDDIIDARDFEQTCRDIDSGKIKTVSWESVCAKLEKRFPGITKEASA